MNTFTFKSTYYYDDEPGGDDVTRYCLLENGTVIWETWVDFHEYFEDSARIDKEIREELSKFGLDMGYSQLVEACQEK